MELNSVGANVGTTRIFEGRGHSRITYGSGGCRVNNEMMSCSLLPSLAVGRRSSTYERFQDESIGLLSLMVVGARFRDRAGDARSIAGGAVCDIGGAINTEF